MSAARPPRRSPVAGIVVTGVLGLTLLGCTVPSATSGTSSSLVRSASVSAAAAPAGATIVVTVPNLPALSSVAAASPTGGTRSPATTAARSSTAGGSKSGAGITPTSRKAPASIPATPTVGRTAVRSSPSAIAISTPVPSTATSAATSTATSKAASAGPSTATLNVKIANCPTCTVLATHAGVTSTLGAALVATGPGRAALLALRADGSVAGVGNVVYGTVFPSPPGGQLACGGGRCVVIAQQSNGTAIASAYQVSAQGVWAEVTGLPGIASVTSRALTVPVGGDVDVAVQDQSDGTTVWTVYAWQGDGYGVKGCTAAPTPDPGALTMDACLS